MNDRVAQYRFVVVGKTGCGKSTLCNTLLGDTRFPVADGPSEETTQIRHERTRRRGYMLHVVDTPDVFNMGYSPSMAEQKFKEWEMFGPADAPTAILFAVSVRERLTPGDDALYKRYMETLPQQYRHRIIFVFTFCEKLTRPVENEIQLSSLYPLVRELGGRFVQLSKEDSEYQVRQAVDQLIRYTENMRDEVRTAEPGILSTIVRYFQEFDFNKKSLILLLFGSGFFFLYLFFGASGQGNMDRSANDIADSLYPAGSSRPTG